ncbi:CLUMA_CG010704, isoform A [Clunio marinus]|uniref:CLUMA_CG010704, isoform A n=1 Tax=Clunio marinus TaxID=568069 RepID=A0A1J1IAK1_9DIPT|nr:CLUMA_CG010704, isoform A [Clunio marinus]
MLSPKMQRSVRVNENQLIMLSDKAQYDHSMKAQFKGQMRYIKSKNIPKSSSRVITKETSSRPNVTMDIFC